jgi:cytochrome P450
LPKETAYADLPCHHTEDLKERTQMLKEVNHKGGIRQAGLETLSAHRMSGHGMKRTYFPGITDVFVVTDPAEIRAISNDSRFDRDFLGHGPVRNVQLLRKVVRAFSLNGRLYPPLLPRTDPSRAAAQEELRSRLDVKAEEVKHGPAELEPLAEWVRGIGTAEKLGMLVQQSIGRLFVESFTATEESLAAARMVLEAASSNDVLRMLWWRISGRLERAKALLASMVNGDLIGVIAMSTARQLIDDGLHKMRQLAADPALRTSITTEAAVDECLFAPPTVLRQAKTSGEVGGCPFKRGSLFILALGSASIGASNRDLVFLSQSWSHCAAEKWVPALLEGVWTRVSATLDGLS